MRSSGADQHVAQRFGALICELGTRAGYDLRSGQGGRAALARDIGTMGPSAVSRMLDGKTLPMPHQMEAIARVVHADVRTLLVTAGVISGQAWPKDSSPPVISPSQAVRLSPEDAADMWGITDPGLRDMLIGAVQNAIRLQNQFDSERRRGGATNER